MLADSFNTHVHCHEQWTHTRHFAKHIDSQGSQVKPDISFEGRGWERTAGTPGVHHGGILGFKSGRMKKLDQSCASCLPYVCIVLAVGKERWGWTRKSVRGREIRKRGGEWRWHRRRRCYPVPGSRSGLSSAAVSSPRSGTRAVSLTGDAQGCTTGSCSWKSLAHDGCCLTSDFSECTNLKVLCRLVETQGYND